MASFSYHSLCGSHPAGSTLERSSSVGGVCPRLLEYRGLSEVKSLSRVRFCDPVDCGLPLLLFHGIFQARVLEWGAVPFSWGSSRPRDQTQVSRIVGRRFTI